MSRKVIPKLAFAFSAFVLSHSYAYAASFDCGKATTTVEKTICAIPQLSSMDEEMAQLYSPLAKSSRETVLSQRDWLRYGRNACKDQSCLANQYQQRINEFKTRTHLHWAERSMPQIATTNAFSPGSVVFTQATPELNFLAKWLKENNIIDNAYLVARAKYNYPASLKISARLCGTSNAYYVAEQDAVFICYELINDIYQRAFTNVGNESVSATDRTARFVTALNFVVLHELGHAALHNRSVRRNLADREGEADNFSYVLLIERAKDLSELFNQVHAVNYALNAFEVHYNVVTLSGQHALPNQRFYKYVCMASAQSDVFAAQAIKAYNFPSDQIARCKYEWPGLRAAAASLMRN